MLKPVLIVGIHNRFRELSSCLAKCEEHFGEFVQRPDVVVVWGNPNLDYAWTFAELHDRGLVDHVLLCPRLPHEGEKGGVSYPWSHNLRDGLDFVNRKYGRGHYAVVQTADVVPMFGVYTEMDIHMQNGGKGVLVTWNNPWVPNLYHTNFFAVALQERLWPPLVPADSNQVMEYHWRFIHHYGLKVLSREGQGEVFSDEHLTEHAEPWPKKELARLGDFFHWADGGKE